MSRRLQLEVGIDLYNDLELILSQLPPAVTRSDIIRLALVRFTEIPISAMKEICKDAWLAGEIGVPANRRKREADRG